jgi:hypothetical protein
MAKTIGVRSTRESLEPPTDPGSTDGAVEPIAATDVGVGWADADGPMLEETDAGGDTLADATTDEPGAVVGADKLLVGTAVGGVEGRGVAETEGVLVGAGVAVGRGDGVVVGAGVGVCVGAVEKAAVVDMADDTVRSHDSFWPAQPPVQPVKTEPLSGVAVKVRAVP